MFSLEQTGQFKKDIKLAKKRGLNFILLNEVVTTLVESGELGPRYKAHKLIGNYKGFWECHIQPDWLLIWEQNDSIKLVTLIRTGKHTDLF
ncbi:type II toxin-antitoxin system YafQ family toxin [Sphingobacterium faecale]|uniref:Type II toxin-antitoxin system YafQ family toxin n=1 Tax=Sphingobacterium faecale TaxID=2803775 RepID=A0ABS1R724_9SPHI|nr:type II toxin-antitoxin system YafQ family toxin [Sphingobacterium faecale]MBL1410369.1 type II toxin-antitoxin system YafQ family toxin [Sphingobacterium faecale]